MLDCGTGDDRFNFQGWLYRLAASAGANGRGQDLLEALGGGYRFDRLEVFHGLDLQFEGGIFVNDDHGMRVQLQTGERPHVVHTAFDASLEGEGFVRAGDDYDDFASLKHRLHTHR